VSHWSCDEASGVRYDSNTTNSNDLTDNNTVLAATGLLSNACDFESSSSEYLSITDVAQIGLDFSTAFTIAYWVNFESDTDPVVIAKYSTGQQAYWNQITFSTNNNITDSSETASAVSWTPSLSNWYYAFISKTHLNNVITAPIKEKERKKIIIVNKKFVSSFDPADIVVVAVVDALQE